MAGAVAAWEHEVAPAMQPALARLRRRVQLGQPPERAVLGLRSALADDALALSSLLAVHRRHGGDVALMLDRLAAAIDERAAAESGARAAAAGASLSARMVAGLPLLFIPFLPLSRAPLLDGAGLFLMATGVALALAGLRWVAKLVPRPPSVDDPVATVADSTASVLDGGLGLAAALSAVADHAPADVLGELQRAKRLTLLGIAWPEALARLDRPEWRQTAAMLRHAQALGLPCSRALRALAQSRRTQLRHEFDAAMRRAPVVMVVPLVCCVLPSFVLLGIAPFLRGLAIG